MGFQVVPYQWYYDKYLITVIALVVFCIAAVYNKGYYHYDEHYQIIEFAELKNGNNQSSDMAWEYEAKIRSASQPLVFFTAINCLRYIGIEDPYHITTIVRLLVGFISVSIITLFIDATIGTVPEKLKKSYRILSYFLFFIPFISIRFSSENFAALSFLLAVRLLYKPENKNTYYVLGIYLGLSFLFRFQTAFMSVGLLLWLVVVSKIRLYNLMKVLITILLIVNAGALIDYWFYGVYTYTFVNYFTANIVNDAASGYGTSPWYYYIQALVGNCSLPLAFTLIVSIIIQLFFNSSNLLVWIIIPFILVHLIIPHKELRFLFPIGNLMPLIIISTISILLNRFKPGLKWLRAIAILFLIINSVGLVLNVLSPADAEGQARITQYIHQNYQNEQVLLYYGDVNPYRPITPKQKFYLDANVTHLQLSSSTLINNLNDDITRLLVLAKKEVPDNARLINQPRMKHLFSGVPNWIQNIRHFLHIGTDRDSFELFEIKKK